MRCPICGKAALPYESRCLQCNFRLADLGSQVADGGPKVAEKVIPPLPSTGIVAGGPAPEAKYGVVETPPENRRCPECHAPLAEQAVLCIDCGYDFRLGQVRSTVVEHEEASPRRGPLPAGFRSVRLGLTFQSARILLTLLAAVLLVGEMMYLSATRGVGPFRPPLWFTVVFLGGVGASLLSVILGLAGSILCLWVPRGSRARLPLILALGFDVAALVLAALSARGEGMTLPAWGSGLCSWALFLMFVHRLANAIDRPSEAHEARMLLLYGLCLCPLLVLLGTAILAMTDLGSLGFPIAVLLGFAGGLYFRIQLITNKLLESLRDSITLQLNQKPADRGV